MKIETKFNIGDFAKRKYDSYRTDEKHVLEVMEILTQTCCGGTQIFYLCRHLIAKKEFKDWKQEGEFIWVKGHSIPKEANQQMWVVKYREDELLVVEEETANIFKESF